MGLASGIAVAIAVIAVAVSAYEGISSQLRSQVDSSLVSLTGSILARANVPAGGTPAPRGGRPAGGNGGPGGPPHGSSDHADSPDLGLQMDNDNGPPFGGAPGIAALVYPSGTVYNPPSANGKVPVTARDRALAVRGSGRYFSDREVKGTDLRVLATGIALPDDGSVRRAALLVALPLSDVAHTLHRQLLLLAIIAALGIALAALLAFLVARTALAPIARFTRQTEGIADNPERLETDRVDVHGGDELGRLAQAFNRTLDALATSVRAQRNLVADASHELRTPIASIRANLQLMRDEQRLPEEDRAALRRDVIDELDDLTALVADVVELARGSTPSTDPDEVRLDQIVEGALARARRRAPGLSFDEQLEPALVHGDGDRISRAVTNLLDNAAKYGAAGGSVQVALSDGVLTVADHGPGFREADLPFVFDRFHRARDARSKPGSGLGLAIVRQAADAHGGFVEASNGAAGGAILRVSFGPVSAPPEDV
ncbi:MAG: HAMP domain-containing sensor histidine kinase [Solirubrobacteraceae bacterium]